MNAVTYLFIAVSATFLLLTALVIFTKDYKPWIYKFFSVFFWIIIVVISIPALQKSGLKSGELKITNYTSQKGNLFFFKEKGCKAMVWYDLPVSNNEERFLKAENPAEGYGFILFVTSRDSLFSVPVPEPGSAELDIWEKELKPAENCYRMPVEAWQERQKEFSLTTGLSLLAILLLYWYRRRKKQIAKIINS